MTTPDAPLDALLDAWLADPSPETRQPLAAAARAAGAEDDRGVRREAARLLRDGDPAEALRVLESALPGAVLSPSLHAGIATALRALERPAEAERHERAARAAVEAVLASGDGTAEKPWSVLRVADEHDVLRALGRRPEGQSLVERGGRTLDRLVTTDGGEAWFRVAVAPAPARARTRG
ncbi:DUF4919 domain-containing protein [Nocardioides deserti]|uniref:DUF4919 domain-containing protein n=1 Tax=Nocardioides deserti TaxID=1588644 RepID=A0ABR6UAW4_9ACTN|nr:DUF4919 domain-containing protein [Nocardioides deserti]MBC2961582.1 DUF4919 domain-containing protein [Nocardioides deserti]